MRAGVFNLRNEQMIQYLIAVAPLVGGYLVGRETAESVRTWYPTLKKPWWTPPNRLFGPVWTVLYLLMGVAAAAVYTKGGGGHALALFAAHLAVNLAWSHVFFVQRDLRKASAVVVALVVSLLFVISEFAGIDPVAAKLLWPYAAWASYAAALTLEIQRLNTS
jgi:translocator protein